jgi:hypothetical protein
MLDHPERSSPSTPVLDSLSDLRLGKIIMGIFGILLNLLAF